MAAVNAVTFNNDELVRHLRPKGELSDEPLNLQVSMEEGGFTRVVRVEGGRFQAATWVVTYRGYKAGQVTIDGANLAAVPAGKLKELIDLIGRDEANATSYDVDNCVGIRAVEGDAWAVAPRGMAGDATLMLNHHLMLAWLISLYALVRD